MTHTEKFHDTISILVKAYMDDTLVHKACTGCAVGNLISAKMNFKQIADPSPGILGINCFMWDKEYASWWEVIQRERKYIHNDIQLPQGLIQIASTGYCIDEIILIEDAFENVYPPELQEGIWCRDDDYMLRGLFSVVDVLAEIHGISLEQKESAKLMFVK